MKDTSHDVAEAVDAFIKHGSIRAAAKALGIPATTMQHRLDKARHVAAAEAPEPPKTIEQLSVEASLRESNRQLSRSAEQAKLAVSARDAQIETLLGLQNDPPAPPAWVGRRRVGEGSDEPGTPMFLWCDWHIGETVYPDQVFGVNEYNESVTDRRIETLISRSIYLATKHRRVANADGAVVFLNGDFVSGWQHEELIASDWCSPLQSVRFACSRLIWALERMRETFGKLLIVCCAGNHGRLREGGFAGKPPAKNAMFSAYDWLIYSFLEDTLGNKAGLTFVIPAANSHVAEVQGTRYLLQHGHELGVKGGDGLIGSIGPMMRGRQKAGRAGASLGRHFDQLVLGHFHQNVWMPDQGLIVGNTLKGYDEYARRSAFVATTPSQLMWWTHPVFGPTSNLQVFVEDPRKAA